MSAVTDMDVDAVDGVNRGFLVSGNPYRRASLIYPSSAQKMNITVKCASKSDV